MIKDRLAKLQLGKKWEPEKNIVRICKYFGWTLEYTLSLPIPAYFELIRLINETEKEDSEVAKHGRKT